MSEFQQVIEINTDTKNQRKLTQAVLQIIQILDLLHAELARILHLQCPDIGLMANAKIYWSQSQNLIPGSEIYPFLSVVIKKI